MTDLQCLSWVKKRHQQICRTSSFRDARGAKLGFLADAGRASLCEVSRAPPGARRDKVPLRAGTRRSLADEVSNETP